MAETYEYALILSTIAAKFCYFIPLSLKDDGGTGTMNIFLLGTRTTTTFTQLELTCLLWISEQISIPPLEHIGRNVLLNRL